MSMTLEKAKALTDIIGTIFGVTGAIVAGFFAGYQYLEAKKAEQIKETISFVNRLDAPVLHDSLARLSKTWIIKEPEIDSHVNNKEDWNSFVIKVVSDHKLENDVISIIDYYKGLQLCVREEICDRKTAIVFLKSDARTFYRLHYPFISQLRTSRNDPSFAVELESFVKG